MSSDVILPCPGGRTEIGSSFLDDFYDVTCTCGFEMPRILSKEAAEDTVAWHQGRPSALGGDL